MSRWVIAAFVISLTAGSALAQPGAAGSPRIHVILVANTVETRLGAIKGVERWQARSDLIEKYTGITPSKTELIGENCSVEAVRKACSDLRVGPSDTVLFYYNGHGFTFAKDKKAEASSQLKYPAMRLQSSSPEALLNAGTGLKEEGLRVVDIFGELAAKKPRLLLVIGDCCDNWLPGKSPHLITLTLSGGAVGGVLGEIKEKKVGPGGSGDLVQFASLFHRVSDETQIKNNFRRLYLEEKGYYLITGSRLGQKSKAWSETGPEFTRQLDFHLGLMERTKHLNGFIGPVSWKLMFVGMCSSPLYEKNGETQQGQWDLVDQHDVETFVQRNKLLHK
jgi:hypothetical protein